MIAVVNVGIANYGTDSKKTTAVYEFMCSELSDIEKLPTYGTDEHPYCNTAPHPGSTCVYVGDDGLVVYILGVDNKWHNISN